MTCIVGAVEKGIVHLGGDSAMSSGGTLLYDGTSKVFRRNGLVLGSSGSVRQRDLLRHVLEFPKPPLDDAELAVWMRTAFVASLRSCFKDAGYTSIEHNAENFQGAFLVGCGGHLYAVYGDFQVAEFAERWHAIGSGQDYALGALWALRDAKMPMRKRVTVALSAAAHHCTSVRKPFHFVTAYFRGRAK